MSSERVGSLRIPVATTPVRLQRHRLVHSAVAETDVPGASGPVAPTNVLVVLLDSLNRHKLGCYGGHRGGHPHLDPRRPGHAFPRHVTGSLPCMPARHDILCGALDFLWKPWGSIELWERPSPPTSGRGGPDDAGLRTTLTLRDRRRELPHRLRLGLRAGPRGRPLADAPRPELVGSPDGLGASGSWSARSAVTSVDRAGL